MTKKGEGNKGHTPGRGHRRKSEPQKKKRFQKRSAKRKVAAQTLYQKALKRWDVMTPEQRKLLPELHPDNFKP